MQDYHMINLGSEGPDCMPEVYFYEIPIGKLFLWKNRNYKKTGEEEAEDVRTGKKHLFEIHYRVAVAST